MRAGESQPQRIQSKNPRTGESALRAPPAIGVFPSSKHGSGGIFHRSHVVQAVRRKLSGEGLGGIRAAAALAIRAICNFLRHGKQVGCIQTVDNVGANTPGRKPRVTFVSGYRTPSLAIQWILYWQFRAKAVRSLRF
jgi:hypothetical protein